MADAADAHMFPVRVYYEDTDAGGVVYHASYLRFAERARTEMLRGLGFDHAALRDRHGLAFAVRRCEAEFVRPARLDDLLEVRTRPGPVSGAAFWLVQDVVRGGDVLVAMRLRLVCVRASGRAARLPAALRASVSAAPLPVPS